jgi:hypothetical protein
LCNISHNEVVLSRPDGLVSEEAVNEVQYRRREFLKYAAKIGLGGVAAAAMADRLFFPRSVCANTQIASDNFVGADANPIGGNYATYTGKQPIQRNTNTGRGTSASLTSAAFWNANTPPAGCYSEFAMTTKISGSSAHILARTVSGLTQQGYSALFNGTFGSSAIGQLNFADGTAFPNPAAAFLCTINSGDIIRLSCQGTAIGMLINGVLVNSVQNQGIARETTYQAAGLAGVLIFPNSATTDVQLTDFAIGTEGDSRFVQQIPFGLDVPPQSSVTVTPTVSQGNLMIVLFGSGDQSSIPTVTSPGDVWNAVPVQFSVVFHGWMFWAKAATGGSKTITVTKNAGVSAGHMACTFGEYNLKNAVLDQNVVTTAASGSPSATVTPIAPNELLIAYASDPTGNPAILGLNGMAYRGGGPLGNGSNPTGAFDEIGLFDGTGGAANSPVTATLTTVPSQWEMILASFYGQGGTLTVGPTKTAGPTVKQ